MPLTRTSFAVLAVFLLSPLLALAQTWSVQSAKYGIGNKQQDVTATVRRLVKGPNFQVSNKDLGTDPAPGQDKTLQIIARNQKGAVRTFTYKEREMVDTKTFGGKEAVGGIVEGSTGLRIVHAAYNELGATKSSDVTQRLQSMVKNNRLQVVVNSKTMGADPAPGKPKQLIVRYQLGDRVYTEAVKDNSELILPSAKATRGIPVE